MLIDPEVRPTACITIRLVGAAESGSIIGVSWTVNRHLNGQSVSLADRFFASVRAAQLPDAGIPPLIVADPAGKLKNRKERLRLIDGLPCFRLPSSYLLVCLQSTGLRPLTLVSASRSRITEIRLLAASCGWHRHRVSARSDCPQRARLPHGMHGI